MSACGIADRRRPDESENVLLRFLDPDQELELSSGRKKGGMMAKSARPKTMQDGKLVYRDQTLKLEEDDKAIAGLQEQVADDDDLTASEGEFEVLPAGFTPSGFAISSGYQGTVVADNGDDDDTVDEDEDEAIQFTLASAAGSSPPLRAPSTRAQNASNPPGSPVFPSPPSDPPTIRWEDIRGTMGPRRGRNGRMLVPGQSDDEDGSEQTTTLPMVSSGSAMRMKTFVANSRGKDRARKEEDQAAYVSFRWCSVRTNTNLGRSKVVPTTV